MWTEFKKNIWTFCPDNQLDGQSNHNTNISATWEAFNPIQLTDMYGNDETNPSEMRIEPVYDTNTNTNISATWEAFKPIHLTEMYGNGETNPSEMGIEPVVYDTNTSEAGSHMISMNGFLQDSISSTSGNCMDPVNNIKPDVESWSAFNPMHLTEMYRTNDVKPTKTSEGLDITLYNHSTDTSAFVIYSCVKQMNIKWPNSFQATNGPHVSDDYDDEEEEELKDAFNFERTHFIPIDEDYDNEVDEGYDNEIEDEDYDSEMEENFVDGFTFNISTSLNTLELERSSSGILRYMSEQYLEYNCNNIEVANSNKLNTSSKGVFVTKFLVKRSGEIACQTEEGFQSILISDEGDSPKEIYSSYDINNINDDNLSNSEDYGCGLRYIFKSLFKKITRCCCCMKKSIKKRT